MSSSVNKILLASGLGIGLAASSALLYLLFKEEEECTMDSISAGSKIVTSQLTEIKIHIPPDEIGRIIGRGGLKIKRIEKETNTRIHFEESKAGDKDSWHDTPEAQVNRFAVIKGSAENVKAARELIKAIITQDDDSMEVKVSIPYGSVGYVIGRGGETVKAIQRVSGARVKVPRGAPSPALSKDDLIEVSVKGQPDQIETAKQMIMENVHEYEEKRGRHREAPAYNRYRLALDNKSFFDTDTKTLLENNYEQLVSHDSGSHTIEVYVSSSKSPSQFWCQIYGQKGSDLDRLCNDLTDYYEVEENRRKAQIEDELKIGDIVIAPYPYDEHYYRCKVIEVERDSYEKDNPLIKVYYLDFGDDAQFRKKELCRVINDEYLHRLPFQAIECELHGVTPAPPATSWSEEACSYFAHISYAAQWHPLLARVIGPAQADEGIKRPPMIIELIDTKNESKSDQNLAHLLVEKGFAISTTSESSEEDSSEDKVSPDSEATIIMSESAINAELSHQDNPCSPNGSAKPAQI